MNLASEEKNVGAEKLNTAENGKSRLQSSRSSIASSVDSSQGLDYDEIMALASKVDEEHNSFS